jgi:hypothetical protein
MNLYFFIYCSEYLFCSIFALFFSSFK